MLQILYLIPSSPGRYKGLSHFLHSFIPLLWEKGLSPPAETEAQRDSVSLPTQGQGMKGVEPDLQLWAGPQVEEQMIHYVHDGSETRTDSLILVANASEMDRQSHPVAFTITILPVNDQPPALTTNTGLQVRAF